VSNLGKGRVLMGLLLLTALYIPAECVDWLQEASNLNFREQLFRLTASIQ
jgi:hypothetical protein